MVCGYKEPEHTVAQEVVQEVDGQRRRLQLRNEIVDEESIRFFEALSERMKAMTVPRDLPTYIAIEKLNEEGRVTHDVLLFYKAEDATKVVEDWDRLVADPAAKSADLPGWDKKIVQGMGYLRGGGVIMY